MKCDELNKRTTRLGSKRAMLRCVTGQVVIGTYLLALPLDVHFRFSLHLWAVEGKGMDVSGSEVSELTAGTDERNMLLPFAFTSISTVRVTMYHIVL